MRSIVPKVPTSSRLKNVSCSLPFPSIREPKNPSKGREGKLPTAAGPSSHENTVALLGSLAGSLRLLDLGNHQLERLGDVGVVRGAGLGPATLQPLAQLAALLDADLALLRPQIALVTDDDDGDGLGALETDRELAS
jgi:hypothetical protein